jgi:Fe-S cluster assembly protein SufD
MTINTKDSIDTWVDKFKAFEKGLNGESTSPVHGLRRKALTSLQDLGFPTTKHEEWRFTNISPIVKTQFAVPPPYLSGSVPAVEVRKLVLPGFEGTVLVFVNGHYAADLSIVSGLPREVKAGSLAAAMKTDPETVLQHLARYASFSNSSFVALSTAFMHDGAYVYVPPKTVVPEPIFLLFVTTGDTRVATHPRNLIVVGEQSQVTIIERYTSPGQGVYLTNTVSEVVAGEGAIVEHDRLQDESMKAFHVNATHIHQHARSNVISNAVSLGGSLVRNNITAVLDAEGCECTLNGLSLSTGEQLIDNHTAIDHAKPNCVSHELYKAVLDGKSRGVFNGKIFVRKDAQKTDAKQTNKTLLLSDEATMDTKPQLEIFADDVRCTHGATVGHLDDEQLFYCRSRGIAVDDARDLLTFGFASDVVNRIHVDALQKQLDIMIQARLRQGRLVSGV